MDKALVFGAVAALGWYLSSNNTPEAPNASKSLNCLNGKTIKQVLNETQPVRNDDKKRVQTFNIVSELIRKSLKTPHSIQRVGSFGRGTHLTQSHDIDVLVTMSCDIEEFMKDLDNENIDPGYIYSSINYQKQKMPKMVQQWRQQLIDGLQRANIHVNTICDKHMVKIIKNDISFDIILVPNVPAGNKIILQKIQGLQPNNSIYRMLSASLEEMKLTPYKRASADVKSMIRMAKYWAKSHEWNDRKSVPFSFFIEAVMYDACHDSANHAHHDVFRLFLEYMISSCKGSKSFKDKRTGFELNPTRYGMQYELKEFAEKSLVELTKVYKNDFKPVINETNQVLLSPPAPEPGL